MVVSNINEFLRVSFPALLLGGMALAVGTRLTLLHMDKVDKKPASPRYDFRRETQGIRGTIYSASGVPLAQTVATWYYYLDPVAAAEDPVRPNKPVSSARRMENVKRISEALDLPLAKVMDAYARMNNRHIFLASSTDSAAHDALFGSPDDSERVKRARRIHGLIAEEKQVRVYPQGHRLSHVLGFVNKDPLNAVGGAGIELKYERHLRGTPGLIRGIRDAYGREVRIRRSFDANAQPGGDVYLTIDHNIQAEVEKILQEGLKTYRAEKVWAIVLSVKTGAVLAMASLPDYDPENFNRPAFDGEAKRNCALSENYEPGSVMKVITACAVLNERMATPNSAFSTSRNDPRYYRLPSDSHRMDPTMTLTDALVHSSNVIFGKLGVDLGPERLGRYMKAFGLGHKTGIDLPGEETGILPNPAKWDKVKWSRAPIGQGISVTGIQMAGAYACIGNDGELLRPYVVERITRDGETIFDHARRYENSGGREVLGQAVRPEVARQVRAMMVGVAKKGGTARRAAIPGYTIAGKTGTAQMKEGRGYSQTNFNASFIGIVPAAKPEIVVLVTYQKPFFCRSYKLSQETGIPLYNHQGGLCAAPTFKKIAMYVLRYLAIEPDVPDEMPDEIE